MDREKQDKLKAKYPDLLQGMDLTIQESCMAWGLEVGDGWHDLLAELLEKLSKLDGVVLTQVKEKFGLLRVYNDSSEESYEQAEKFIDEAESISAKICEKCGEPGELKGGGWLMTLCDDCERIRSAPSKSVARRLKTQRE